MAKTTIDILNDLNLLSWDVLAYGRQRGWVTASDLSTFAIACLAADIDDTELPAVAELASAETLSADEVDQLLSQLSSVQSGQDSAESNSWRLAKLVELQSQGLEWDDKVTRLEGLAAEFGFPADMQGCSRYAAGTADPLDEMEALIANLRNQLGVS
jgi:hypothetical protein